MPVKIDPEKLFKFVKTIEEKLLTTSARKTQFSVKVLEDDLVFTPISSGKPRKEVSRNIVKVIERFNDSKSIQPKDYQDITFNSVYLVTLIEMYLKVNA